jgi:hypothetical protein
VNRSSSSRKPSVAPGHQLVVEDLLARARLASGLSDFGDPWFLDPLQQLVGFVNREADLPSADVWPVRRMVDMLCDRLKLVDYLKRHPGVHDEEVDVAAIIVMHARGGSTLTQRLLGRSRQLRATYFWELHTPVPLPARRAAIRRSVSVSATRKSPHGPARCPSTARCIRTTRFHEEDLVLCDRGFLSYMYSCQFNIPGYHAWMAAHDETRSYQELRLWLQLLQYQAPQYRDRRWLLKSVHHFIGRNLRTMFATFPGTKAIMTHRPMDEVIPSLCSVQSMHIRQSGAPSFDHTEMGRRLAAQYLPALEEMIALRDDMPRDTFIDVQYRDLLANPIGEFERVLDAVGLPSRPRISTLRAPGWRRTDASAPSARLCAGDFGVTGAELATIPLLSRRIRGQAMTATDAASGLQAGWQSFLEALATIPSQLHLDVAVDDPQLTGERVQQLAMIAAQAYPILFSQDPRHPQLVPFTTPVFRAGTNPDFNYLYAALDGRASYTLSGNRGTSLFVHVVQNAGCWLHEHRSAARVARYRHARHRERRIVLRAAAAHRPDWHRGDWWPLDERSTSISIRQASND